MIGRVAAVTDPGRMRRHNEDAYVTEPPLFAIADGMGGTITVALVEDDHVAFGHVGDSRAYLIRDGQMEQLTEDHSLVNELMKSGKLSREEAETHPQRSVITRALGTDPDVDVDTFSVSAQTGDLFLLCSDGLTDMVSEDAILGVVEHHRDDIDGALRALVKEAYRGGGEDNITVVAFEIADVAVHDGQTQEQALPPELARKVEEEETLDEADEVPVVEVAEVEEEAGKDATQRRHRRRRALAWLALLPFLAAGRAPVGLGVFG